MAIVFDLRLSIPGARMVTFLWEVGYLQLKEVNNIDNRFGRTDTFRDPI